MKERIGKIVKDSYFFEWYYLLVILCYVATLFTGLARPGVFATLLMVAILVELFVCRSKNIPNIMDVLIVVYFLYKLTTIIWIIKGGIPVSVFADEVAMSCLPMIFYFAAKMPEKNKNHEDGFYKKFLVALFILGIVGFVLYITAPQFYCDYLYNWTYISKADASTMRVRMQSVVGCTVLGAIMVAGMGASAHFIEVNKEVSGTKEAKNRRIFAIVSLLLTMFFAVMSNMRSAMVIAALLLVYILYFVVFKFGSVPKKNLYIGIGVALVLFVLLCLVRFDFVLKIWWRIESLPGAISQRSEQWVAAVNNMYSSWFGNGLGANGHKAIGVEGAHIIADGGLIKLYCEEGVIGFSLFLYTMILTFKYGFRNINKNIAEIGIISAVLLGSIGSNVIAFQLVNPIFWYAVGRISKSSGLDLKNTKQKENEEIE